MRLLDWSCAALAALSMIGCAELRTTLKGVRSFEQPVWTTDGMYLADLGPGVLFLAPTARNLRGYRRVLLDEIRIGTKQGSPKLRASEREWLEASVRRTLLRMLGRNDWSLANAPAPDVLRVRVALFDLEFQRNFYVPWGTVMLGPSGRASIVLELRDSLERDRLLLYGDKSELPFRVYYGSRQIPVWRVRDAFYEFSLDAHRLLVAAQRGHFESPPHPNDSPTP